MRVQAVIGRTRYGVVMALLLAQLVMPHQVSASSKVLKYPGAAPCAMTLQACITGAAAGDTIEIVTNTPIDESLTINKSLTLTAGHGSHPVIGAPSTASAVVVAVEDNAGSRVAVTMSHLHLREALLNVSFEAKSGDRFTFAHSTLEHHIDSNNETGIDVTTDQTGAIERVVDDVIKTTGQPIELNADLPGAGSTQHLFVTGNTLTRSVKKDAYHGITLSLYGTGGSTVDIYSNVIHHMMGCFCGGGGAIDVSTSDSDQAVVNIVGNTIDHTQDGAPGIEIYTPTPTAKLTANIFDNIITNSDGGAYLFPAASASLKINNGYNDLFGEGPPPVFGGYAKGPKTISKPPGYVNPGKANYRLKPRSAVLDKGEICTPGGLSRSDAAGRFRITGHSLDLGAYELGAGAVPKGSNIFGTNGPNKLTGTSSSDIICGFGGADTIRAGRGADLVFGGNGNDRIFGDSGNDQLFGDRGHDLLVGGPGSDYLNARDGHGGDRVEGGSGHDRCVVDRGDHVSSCP
jgi:Ca2+-binding RTX toxin-like protein